MRPWTPTGPRFTPRDLPAPDVATFIAERFARPTLPCRGEVVLHAPAELVARWAGAEALVEAIDEQRCRLVTSSWSWVGLAAMTAMFDVDIEIVGPDELRAAAATLHHRFMRAGSR
jgi:hypothetical protein